MEEFGTMPESEKTGSRVFKFLERNRSFAIRFGWNYLASTCFIGLLAFSNITEAYPMLLFPLSGIAVLIIAYALPKKEDENLDSDSSD